MDKERGWIGMKEIKKMDRIKEIKRVDKNEREKEDG